jgi:hypothetical protein
MATAWACASCGPCLLALSSATAADRPCGRTVYLPAATAPAAWELSCDRPVSKALQMLWSWAAAPAAPWLSDPMNS